jgi:hypothetical protein
METVVAEGLDVSWPSRVTIARIAARKPYALIEREKNGTFPLREMLSRPETSSDGARPPIASTPPEPRPPAPATPSEPRVESPPGPAPAIAIGEIVVAEGDARFVDRGVTPFFSEEMSRIELDVRGLQNTTAEPANLTLHAVVGPNGALELSGRVSPFGQPVVLDVSGELKDLALAQANPYLRHYSGWVARGGGLTTKFHWRVTGDVIEASNEIVVKRLAVAQAPAGDAQVTRRVGLPLGMIVALITDADGGIKFEVPVTGNLSSPGWSVGDAIWAAVRNVLVNVAAAPFRAIGKIFHHGDGADTATQFKVDPILFPPGGVGLSADAEQQLQRVADVLRGSPVIKLVIEPKVTAADVVSLKTRDVVARIQKVQRDRKLADFAAAARAVFAATYANRPVPATPDDIVAALSADTPSPDEAARNLAARRLDVTRQALIERAGIERDRLHDTSAPVGVGGPGEGRVEFELEP